MTNRIPVVVVGFFVAFAAACEQQIGSAAQQTAAGAVVGVEAEFTVDTMTAEFPVELPAQLYVEHDAVVVARTAGNIDSILVEMGDFVSKGQIMARLEGDDQEIALASAEATFQNLTRTAARARALTKSGGTTAADSERVEFELQQAEIARRQARRDVDLTRLVAPFDGVVSARLARPRRFVAVGDTLFRVTEAAPLFARLRVPEAATRSVQARATAVVVDFKGETSTASIVRVAPVIDAASATREVIVRLARPAPNLVAGANVIVRIGRERKRVVAVSREAIAPEGYVVVVDHGRTTTRAVTIGASLSGGRVEVVNGLAPGERLARISR